MCLPPVYADSGKKGDVYAFAAGVPVVVENNIDVTYTGKTWKDAYGNNKYEYVARINQAPIYNDDGSKVDCSWHGIEDAYVIVNNVFSAQVIGAYITTTYQGQSMSWNPIVMVDSKEYVAKGSPRVLAVDPINENYRNNTLEWDYGVCVRHLRVIEGLVQETWIFDKNPKGTVWIKNNSQKSAGFTYAISPYAYDADGNSLVINEYKQVMASEFDKAVYPVTIDPTEQYFTSASDGYLYVNDAVYLTARNASSSSLVSNTSTISFVGQTPSYQVYRSYLYFNTSALPDTATISSANVSIRGAADLSIANFNITIQNGQPTYPHDPLKTTDYNLSYYSSNGGSLNTSAYITSGYNNISMNATGIAWVNLTGDTKLCLRNSKEIAAITPVSEEDVTYYTYEKGAGYRPYIEVVYSASMIPIVVTYSPPTSITNTSANCSGSITDNGSNVITEYGICYGLFPNPDTTGTKNSTSADKLGGFSKILAPLIAGQTYYYRAYATNVLGTGYGAEYTFLTSPNASVVTTQNATYVTLTQARLNGYLDSGGGETCTVKFQYAYWNGTAWIGNVSTPNQSKVTGDYFYEDLSGLTVNTQYLFRAEAINSYGQSNGSWLLFNTSSSTASIGSPKVSCDSDSNSIDLSWTKGANSSNTYIRWKIGSYPTGISDGTLIPLQSGVNYAHTGLASGTSYYYRLWGYDGGNTSSTNTSTMCTTTAGSSTSTPAPLPTVDFSGGNTTPNGSALTNNPLYTLGNQEAAAISVPQGTWWMLVGLGILIVTGLFIYTRSRNLLLSLGAMIIAGVVMANMGMFPIWIMWVFGLSGIGMSWKELR